MRRPSPRLALRVIGSFALCNVCGEQGGKMRTYYSPRAVSNDQVLPGWGIFVSGEHRGCLSQAARHGYTRHAGFPAWFPQVCAGCCHRVEPDAQHVAICLNPQRKENGGDGLRAKRGADPFDIVSCSGRAS